jgi:phospholipid/cholesterol/gamma-HCH transport system substrate-binding protein
VKRANEVLVGFVVLGAIALGVAGTMWLSGQSGGRNDRIVASRFRTIGGLKSGNPVLMQGVPVGRVERIALGAPGWVSVELRMNAGVTEPESTVAVIASRTLFGDWAVQLVSERELRDDPAVVRQIADARAAGGEGWPGATLPDIGQITAQASRIADNITKLSSRVDSTFDSTSVRRLQNSLRDFSILSRSLATIARAQESSLTRIGAQLDSGTRYLSQSARSVARAAARADSSTNREQLQRILSNADSASSDLRSIATDIRGLSTAAAAQQAAISRLIANTDSILAGIQAGRGTLGMLTRDTTLYREAINTVRAARSILDDMQRNPRKYFSFSVF